MNRRTDGQAFLETLLWMGVIMLFLIGCGSVFQLQYSCYRGVLRSAGGYTAPSWVQERRPSE